MIGYEAECQTSLGGPVWMIFENKYLYMNERLVGVLPFEIKSNIVKMVYDETVILVCEEYDKCHVFEVNEFYNIINHQEFVVFKKERPPLNQN